MIKGNKYEVFNEINIYICILIMTDMTNSSENQQANDVRGWLLISVASFNLVINLMITVYQSVVYIFKNRQAAHFKSNAKKALKNHLK